MKKALPASNSQRPSTADHLKNLLMIAGAASVFSFQNLLLIDEPGSGKTESLYHAGRQVFGANRVLKMEGTPGLKEERILGRENPAYMLVQDAEAKGIPYWLTKNTVRDPDIELVVMAEVARMGDAAQDAFVHAMDNANDFGRKIFWADTNWLVPNQRNAAIRDRFAMFMWLPQMNIDIRAVMNKPPLSTWEWGLPDRARIEQVRGWLWEFLTKGQNSAASNTIATAVETIQPVLEHKRFRVNNRRARQWQAILYTMAAHIHNSPDFDTLPKEAFDALTYCYPTENPAQAFQFGSIVMAAVDVVATQIAEFYAASYQQWKQVWEDVKDEKNPAAYQQKVTNKLGSLFQQQCEEAMSRWPDNPEAQKLVERLTTMYYAIYNHQDPF